MRFALSLPVAAPLIVALGLVTISFPSLADDPAPREWSPLLNAEAQQVEDRFRGLQRQDFMGLSSKAGSEGLRSGGVAAAIAAARELPATGFQNPANDPLLLAWSELVDAEAQTFTDPFRDLEPEKLSDLASIARMEQRLNSGGVADAARPRLEARISQKRDALEAEEIDIEWLFGQRWAVAERRRIASIAVNENLEDAEVAIGGFLIPAPPGQDGRATAYLVPERGMCSHMPPPPPNQLLHLVLIEAPDLTGLYAPVIVRGTLRTEETRRELMVVDGMVQMRSAWTLYTESVNLLSD